MEIIAEHPLKLTSLHFDLPLATEEIETFRKLVNRFIGAEDDRFHNHQSGGKFMYRYPVVQYKSLQQKASLLGLGEAGAEALERLKQRAEFREACQSFSDERSAFLLSETNTETLFLHSVPVHHNLLDNYIGLNEHNLAKWYERPSLPARSALLETCLVGHILKFCSAIQWLLPSKSLQVELLDFSSHTTRAFGHPFLAFQAHFRTNITLPPGIGLGNKVSIGFGMVGTPHS